jgi:hypothetical protein
MVSGAVASVGLATALASGRAAGANDRVRLGFIGIANRGSQLIEATLPHADADIVALCDIDENAINLWKGNQKLPLQPRIYKDHRELLAQEDIDAVVIATPDHWHAIQTMEACDAGKDVYIEKPLAMTVHEGRRMVDKARQTNRVVQVGLHRRSSKLLLELRDLVRSGKLGKITMGRSYRLSNMYPNGIGKMAPGDPPPSGPEPSGNSRVTSPRINSAGGCPTVPNWATGAFTTSTSSAGCWTRKPPRRFPPMAAASPLMMTAPFPIRWRPSSSLPRDV